MSAKEIRYHQDARAKMLAGVNALANAVRVTLGPAGTSVRPVVFANSQSTYPTRCLLSPRAAGQRQPHLVRAATIRSNAARARSVPP